MADSYEAILIVSFGGPEKPDEVLPFLENVLRKKNVPRERMLEVAEHYYRFGGVSPINSQIRDLIAVLRGELSEHGLKMSIYWGNRNWHPLLPDTLRQMASDGIRRALAFVTSAYSSYSSCRQYLEDIEQARDEVGANAPVVDKLRPFFNHPGFIEPMIESLSAALAQVPADRRPDAAIVYTAHSIPSSMAGTCQYEAQLNETGRLVSEALGLKRWRLVYQSRSGLPSQPWLEPDVCDYLREQHQQGQLPSDVVILPIGFVSDHIEVLFDLDTEAKALCEALGVHMVRAATSGSHPRFAQMIRQLVAERLGDVSDRLTLGNLGPSPDVCPTGCCALPSDKRPKSLKIG